MSTHEAHEDETQVMGEQGQQPPVAEAENVGAPATAPDGAPTPAAPDQVDGYCVKCKQARTMESVEMTRTKNGRLMAKGKCPVCGTTMTKFMKG